MREMALSKKFNRIFSMVISFLILVCNVAVASDGLLEVDKSGWFDCLDVEDCRGKSDTIFSRLLAEYLDEGGLDLGVVSEAVSVADSLDDGDQVLFIKALVGFVLNDEQSASEYLAPLLGKKSFSVEVVDFLLSDQKQLWNLRIRSVPFLEFRSAKLLVEHREYKRAAVYLDRLFKRYRQNPNLVYLWAKSYMEQGKFPRRMYRQVKKVLKDFPDRWDLKASLLRYYNERDDRKNVEQLLAEVSLTELEGLEGAEFLVEWGRYLMRVGEVDRAEMLLKKSLSLDPKKIDAHMLLGQLYLIYKRDLYRSVASFRGYIYHLGDSANTAAFRTLVKQLEDRLKIQY